MLLLASHPPPLPSLFLRASAASCLLGHATDSVDLARAAGALAVLKCALYELVRRPSAPYAGKGGLVALARCTTLDALQAGEAQYKLARESGVADDYLYNSKRSPKRTRRRRSSARRASRYAAQWLDAIRAGI
ncbi:hypothetical protein FB451DRAFT_1404404 [Mycena latifolia]|nr:hypothetical protein FB451DRAFT_1404404 [Mycena latifolia]